MNLPQNVNNIFDETGEWAALQLRPSSSVRGQRAVSVPGDRVAAQAVSGVARRMAREHRRVPAVGRAVHREPRCGPREHRRRSGAAARSAARSQSAVRRAQARSLVRYGRVRAAGAVHVRQRAAEQRHRSRIHRRRSRDGQDVERWPVRGSSSSAGRSSTCSTRPTSISRTGRSGTPTSAASSAPRARARCNSARVSHSDARTRARRYKGKKSKVKSQVKSYNVKTKRNQTCTFDLQP